MEQRMAESYRETYGEIIQRLTRGRLIHADETHVSVKGKDSYVWVFTSIGKVGNRRNGSPQCVVANARFPASRDRLSLKENRRNGIERSCCLRLTYVP
jgi:hypothetical protein